MFRYLSLILFLLFVASCQRDILPSERIVIFTDQGRVIGRGYDAGDDTIITVTHVVEICERLDCDVLSQLGSPSQIASYKKESWNDTTYLRHPRIILDFVFPDMNTGDSVYTLISGSDGLRRIEGKVTRPDASYISYDLTGSGRLLTGAIEMDIVFEAGESGSPIWTFSGELVGVVSAVDRDKGRSYIVR